MTKSKKGISKKHLKFIQMVADGETQTKSYQVTTSNKKVSGNTARVKGSELAKKYKKEIAKARDVNRKIADAASKESISQAANRDIMSSAERMEILTKIAKGRIPLKKHIVVDKTIEEVEVVPDWMDRKNAIAELNKMDGSYAAQKQDVTVTDKTEFYLPGEDEDNGQE